MSTDERGKKAKEISGILNSYPRNRRFALAVMQDMQRAFKYVPREGLERAAEYFNCPVSSLYSMATFYKALSLTPRGSHIIRLCNGTACHIRGAATLYESAVDELKLDENGNSRDGLFSVELVNCLGSCALAPVMVLDDVYHGKVTIEKMRKLLDEARNGGEAQ